MAAVSKNGMALQHAGTQLRADRLIVMAAVSENGMCLVHASKELCSDAEIVRKAAASTAHLGYMALRYASSSLLEDPGFIAGLSDDIRSEFYFLKAQMMSGNSCTKAIHAKHSARVAWIFILEQFATELKLSSVQKNGAHLLVGEDHIPLDQSLSQTNLKKGALIELQVVVAH